MLNVLTRGAVRLLVTLLTMAALTVAAAAHSDLQSSSPKNGAVLKTSPSEVAITFSEKIEKTYSGLSVRDASGTTVASGTPTISGKSMSLAISSLPPGDYVVVWRVLSVDSHKTDGTFKFKIAR